MKKTLSGRTKKPATKASQTAQGQVDESKKAATPQKSSARVSLQRWHVWLAVIFGAEAVAILLLGVVHKLPISLHYLAPDSLADDGRLVPASHQLFEVNLVQLVAAVLLVSAIAHVVVATVYRRSYEAELGRGVSRAAWLEYGLSTALIMIVLALLGGVYDLTSLMMIFCLAAVAPALHLFANLQKKFDNDWRLWVVALVSALVPWAVLGMYIFGIHVYGMSQLPSFVYWLYASMGVLFIAFALNRYLQCTKRGRWIEYVYGEKMHLILNLVALTVFAWAIFAGVLRA